MTREPISCDSLLKSLSEYVDGELRDELCRALEEHMAGCEDCRITVDTTKKTIYLVHACAESDAQCPEDVQERLMQRLKLDDLLSKANKAK